MRAQDQTQPSPPPPPQSPPPLQQLPGQLQQQLPETICPICMDVIEPNQAVINCISCRKPFHYGDLITWLTNRRSRAEKQDCPACRGDMAWVLGNQQPAVAPAIVFPVPPYNPNNNTPPGLQPAELLDNINNWNWDIALE